MLPAMEIDAAVVAPTEYSCDIIQQARIFLPFVEIKRWRRLANCCVVSPLDAAILFRYATSVRAGRDGALALF